MKLSRTQAILELLTPHALFGKLNIASKMLLGYMTLVVLSVAVVVYVLVTLQRLNALNNEIVKIAVPMQQTADQMLDALVAQDTYEKRYLILNEKEMRGLFWERADEFRTLLATLKKLPVPDLLPLKIIYTLHTRYNDGFVKEVKFIKADDLAGATTISNSELKTAFDKLVETLRAISIQGKLLRDSSMRKISEIAGPAFATTAVLCLLSLLLGMLSSAIVTHHIFSSIRKLQEATGHISEGNFQYDPEINTDDEIGTLARSFLAMGKRLVKFEEMYLDASPLTRLPGGLAIENILKHRLESGLPIALCVIDVDSFKSFNDRYGYAHGNDVIKDTARIIESATKEKGASGDFVGHVGGDDFVVITTPAYMRDICAEIILQFDARVPQFYAEQDRANGYIFGKNRQGVEMRFPLMTISIAVVTNDQRTFINTLEASEIAAELKDYAKTIPSSVYVVDKRRS
jgi:GGDEF domain-containing protein/CHASE3 domain sensor protein